MDLRKILEEGILTRRRKTYYDGEEYIEISYPPPPRRTLNIVLFFLTLFTTTLAGALQEGVNPLKNPALIYKGIPFSFSLMGILLAHELGHYLMARKHGLNVTWPYFIPAPSFIGTFGAFIQMRSPVRNRRMLLDVGAAGPLVGLGVAIPFLILGLKLSEVKIVHEQMGTSLGSSIILYILSWLVIGPIPEGYDVIIHPVGFAGWIGLLVTSLNLLPIGQLDGGHVAYALWGERQNKLSKYVFLGLLALGFFGWPGWLFWALLLFIMGFRHPPLIEWWVPLDPFRKLIGRITMAIFLLTFIPVPFKGL